MTSVFSLLPNVGVPELLIVLAIAVLILGPKRIPAAAKSVGASIRGFRDEVGSGEDKQDESAGLEQDSTDGDRKKSKTRS